MLAVVSFTMTVVMAMGDFDLSVGSIASWPASSPPAYSWPAARLWSLSPPLSRLD